MRDNVTDRTVVTHRSARWTRFAAVAFGITLLTVPVASIGVTSEAVARVTTAAARSASSEPAFIFEDPVLPEDLVEPPGIACYSASPNTPVVKVLYLYQKGTPGNFRNRLPQIREAVAIADLIYDRSAAKTGGSRHPRWKMASGCHLSVTPVPIALSMSVRATRSDLVKRGFLKANEKGLAFRETGPMCGGFGELALDSRPGSSNRNNRGQTLGEVFLAPCLDGREVFLQAVAYKNLGESAAHELAHTLGAVQPGAPHATKYHHCWDESDVMCYEDGPKTVVRSVCPPTIPVLLDCRNDDYFHTKPKPGSYLATHWNVARSRFLATTDPSRFDPVARPGGEIVGLTDGMTLGPGTLVEFRVVGAPDGRPVAAVALIVDGVIVERDEIPPFAIPFNVLGGSVGDRVGVSATVYDRLGRRATIDPIAVVVGERVPGNTPTNPNPNPSLPGLPVEIVAPEAGAVVSGPFEIRVAVSDASIAEVAIDVNDRFIGYAMAPTWSVMVDPAAVGGAAGQTLWITATIMQGSQTHGVSQTVVYEP